MSQALASGESERETEFALMKEIVKKLVHALEDKASTDLISGGSTAYPNTNTNMESGSFNIASPQKLKTLTARKGSLPPPKENLRINLSSPERNTQLPSLGQKYDSRNQDYNTMGDHL